MIKSLEKAFRLLEILSLADSPMRLRDISTKCEMTPSNTFRMLQTLRELGYVRQAEDGSQYELTFKAFEIGARKVASNTLVSAAHPILQRLSEKVSENVMLSIQEGLTNLVVDRIESRAFVRTFAYLGARAPLHAVSGGKILLAFGAEETMAKMSTNLTRFTENTITDPDQLAREVASIREQGYATTFHEINEAARGIAVPVFSRHGTVAAALSISGPMEELEAALIERYVTLLKDHARQIEQAWWDGRYEGRPRNVPRPSSA